MRSFLKSAAAFAVLLAAACGVSPVPSGMFLTLSVSTRDVTVETRINGALEEFVSGASGSLVSSAPINRRVREGENIIELTLAPIPTEPGETVEPALLAALDIAIKGEIVDTMAPGERAIFARELTEEEAARLTAGEKLILTETFLLDRAKLQAMKDAAKG
ncbi:MAG: hypothetical protein RIE56_10655 [Amphiplicatus sp.]